MGYKTGTLFCRIAEELIDAGIGESGIEI